MSYNNLLKLFVNVVFVMLLRPGADSAEFFLQPDHPLPHASISQCTLHLWDRLPTPVSIHALDSLHTSISHLKVSTSFRNSSIIAMSWQFLNLGQEGYVKAVILTIFVHGMRTLFNWDANTECGNM